MSYNCCENCFNEHDENPYFPYEHKNFIKRLENFFNDVVDDARTAAVQDAEKALELVGIKIQDKWSVHKFNMTTNRLILYSIISSNSALLRGSAICPRIREMYAKNVKKDEFISRCDTPTRAMSILLLFFYTTYYMIETNMYDLPGEKKIYPQLHPNVRKDLWKLFME